LLSFFHKIGEQEGRIDPAWRGWWYQWEGEEVGKRVGGRIQCKYYGHMYVNEKMIPAETIPGMAGGDDKG
jgi:hypothetical protein